MIWRLAVASISGFGLSLAFEPVALPWIAPLGIAGYIWSVRGPRAWLPGLVFGVCYCFTQIIWMQAVSPGAWLALAFGLALFHSVFAVVMDRLTRLPVWPVWAALTWTAMELSYSGFPFSGMPWPRISFAMVDTPMAAGFAWIGPTGVSFLVALAGACLLALPSRAAAGGLIAVAVVFTAMALAPMQTSVTGSAQVAVVQGNVPGDGTKLGQYPTEVAQNHALATANLSLEVDRGDQPQPDFVLWPENSTVRDPFLDPVTRQAIDGAVAAIDAPVLVGVMVQQGDHDLLNQGIVWDPATGPGERYTKHHPVPFGEYIPRFWPLDAIFSGANFGGLNQIQRDMAAGSRTDPLVIAGVRIANAICFDVAYDDVLAPQVRRRAELVTVQTSNATFIKTHQIDQQFAITRLRAIETGRTVVVASTNGRSGVIAADGSVLDAVPERQTEVINTAVDLREGTTLAVRLGQWPGFLILGLVIATMVGTFVPWRGLRARSDQTATSNPREHDPGREEPSNDRLQ